RSFTVVLGFAFACFGVTNRPEIALRALVPPPLPFPRAMVLLSQAPSTARRRASTVIISAVLAAARGGSGSGQKGGTCSPGGACAGPDPRPSTVYPAQRPKGPFRKFRSSAGAAPVYGAAYARAGVSQTRSPGATALSGVRRAAPAAERSPAP